MDEKEPVTAILKDLHWLSVKLRIDFKLLSLMITNSCFHGTAHSSLSISTHPTPYPYFHSPFITVYLHSSDVIPLLTLSIHCCLSRLVRRHTPAYTSHSSLSVSTHLAPYPCLHSLFIAVCLDSSGAILLLTLPIHHCLP